MWGGEGGGRLMYLLSAGVERSEGGAKKDVEGGRQR